MNRTVSPSLLSSRRLSKSSSTSCGTSTAVGSSRIRILAPPIEHLEDLDPLPVTHAEVLDQRVRVDVEAVGVGDLLDARPGCAEVEEAALGRLAAEDDVLEHREVVGEHEVLVDHADAGGDGVARRVEAHLLAVDGDRALVGSLHAVEDVHQRRLAGAVLAHDGVHLAAPYGDVDVAVGDDAREALGDASQLDRDVARLLTRRVGSRRGAGGRNGDTLLDVRPGTSDRARGDVSASSDPVVRECDPPRWWGPYFVGTTISPEMIFAL